MLLLTPVAPPVVLERRDLQLRLSVFPVSLGIQPASSVALMLQVPQLVLVHTKGATTLLHYPKTDFCDILLFYLPEVEFSSVKVEEEDLVHKMFPKAGADLANLSTTNEKKKKPLQMPSCSLKKIQ